MKISEALKGMPCPELGRLLSLLAKLPADEVFTTREMAERVNTKPVNLQKIAQRYQSNELAGFCVKQSARMLWGSKKAVETFKKAAAL
jgi:hypothetical protein